MQQLRPAALAYLGVVTACAAAALVAAVVDVVQHPQQLQVLLVLAPIFILSLHLKSDMTAQVLLSANVPILIAAYLIGGWSVACLVGVSAEGKLLWRYERNANGTANIPTVIVKGDLVFCSTGYDSGSALLKLIPDSKGGVQAKEQYFLNGG